MTKSSVVAKYLSTCHPNQRDGLLKGDLKNLPEDESIFHNSPQTYYENRPKIPKNQISVQTNPRFLRMRLLRMRILKMKILRKKVKIGRRKIRKRKIGRISLFHNFGANMILFMKGKKTITSLIT